MKTIGVAHYLHVRTASNPIYDNTGQKVCFITDYSGLPQVWEWQNETGWPSQASFAVERIMFVQYIRGTNQRIIGMDEGVNEKQQLFILQENGELTPLTDSPAHIHHYGGNSPDGKWIAWSSNRRHKAYFDVYIQNLETLEIRQVFEEDGTIYPLKWSPDGEKLLIRKSKTLLYHDLGLLHLDTGEVTWLTVHEGEASYEHPQFSGDGSHLYFLSNKDREYKGLAVMDIATTTISWLDEQQWDLEGLAMSADNMCLAYTMNEGGISKGFIYYLEQHTKECWETPIGVITELTFSPDDLKLAYVLNGPTHPADIWEIDLLSKQPRRLTYVSHSPIVQDRLVKPELILVNSFDGLEVPAFLYRPEGVEGKLPVVIYVHGGPENQIRAKYHPFLQYMINQGFAVCTPNVRGSTGYGRTYTHLDDVRKRMDAIQDLTSVAEWLKTEVNADPDKLAIMGISYGGFAVLSAITHYPNVWSAAIDFVGVSSLRTFLDKTSPWRRKIREAEYGSIANDGMFFDEIDPIHRVDHITCPLIVLHGANDPRVPIEEAEQIVHKLRARNHPVKYIRFEDEGHSFVKLKNNITAYTHVAEFLEQYIK